MFIAAQELIEDPKTKPVLLNIGEGGHFPLHKSVDYERLHAGPNTSKSTFMVNSLPR